jgi:hypothetical protein
MQQLDSSTQFFTNLLSSRCQSMNLLLHTTLHIPALVMLAEPTPDPQMRAPLEANNWKKIAAAGGTGRRNGNNR